VIVLHLDFETRSRADLLNWGAHRYAMHPSTEILCVAIGVGSKREEFIGDAEVRALGERFRRLVESGKDFVIRAHNATFERLICWYVAQSRYDWPHIPLERFECSAVEALRSNLPQSLAMLAPAVGLSIDKDMEGAALMKKMCQPRADGSWLDGPDERARLSSYCLQDVEVEIMASQRMARLSPSERADWLLDQRINDRGIRIDRRVVRNALTMADAAMKAATKRMQAVTGGAVQTPNQVQRLKNWMASKGIVVDSLRAPGLAQLIADDYDPEVDDLLTTDIDSKLFIPPAVKTALEIRLEVAKASTKKLQRMLDAADPVDDRIRGMMQFHGAHTGRPTGRIVQVLNLPRTRKGVKLAQVHAMLDLIRRGDARTLEAEHGPILHCVADCLRGMLIPAEWHMFMDGDFSNIEGRGVAWHAGFESKLDVFRKADAGLGPGVYELSAGAIYGIPPELVGPDSFERFIGKTAELALGFGGAVGAFTAMSATFGVEVELDMVETIVAKWRAANKPITNFWYRTADAAIETVLTRRPHVSGVGPGQVEYRMDGSFLCCRLPSGRDLHYPYPEIRENPKFGGPQLTFKGRHPKTKQFVRLETFHGKLVENIVQASANDIMRHAMHSLERAGFPLVLQIYDEALCEVPIEAVDPAAYRQAMTDLPAWARGFPLAAGDPWVGQEYRK